VPKEEVPGDELILPGKQGITSLAVSGFKSIAEEQRIDIAPLTILAGANSSGKSSIMQPLLILKQTLEASFDPDPILLSGQNVRFASVDDFLAGDRGFSIELVAEGNSRLTLRYVRGMKGGLALDEMQFGTDGDMKTFRLDLDASQVLALLPQKIRAVYDTASHEHSEEGALRVTRERCFLNVVLPIGDGEQRFMLATTPAGMFEPYIRGLIHVPALRGNPARSYLVTGAGPAYPGTFEEYTATVIATWKAKGQSDHLSGLRDDLVKLGLTWKVIAEAVDDTRLVLRVGRLARATRGGARDLVNIADAGFGVSQSLPVLVALRAAQERQVVYVEQPEIHLHPRAQHELAWVLANAANRGVRVIVETHSALLLLGIQFLVATGNLAADDVKLHWFHRDDEGQTHVTSADLDERGAFGDWPEDFGRVSLEAEKGYLDAVQSRLWVD